MKSGKSVGKLTPKQINRRLLSSNFEIRYQAIENPNADAWNINTALDMDDPYLAELAISHPNVNEEHLKKGVRSPHWRVRQYSIQHIKCTVEIAMSVFESDDWNMRWMAINRFAADNFDVVKRCLTDKSRMIREEGKYYLYNYHADKWLHFRATKAHIHHCLTGMLGKYYF